MQSSTKLLSALMLAAVVFTEIQGRPDPRVHHYRYENNGGPDTYTEYTGNEGGNNGQVTGDSGNSISGGTNTDTVTTGDGEGHSGNGNGNSISGGTSTDTVTTKEGEGNGGSVSGGNGNDISGGYNSETVISGSGEGNSEYITDESGSSYGYSDHRNYGANSGDLRKRGENCHRGLAENVGSEAKGILDNAASGIANTFGFLDGVKNAFDRVTNGADEIINDTGCGLANIANEAAEGLDTGDIPGGVKNIAHEFVGGLHNLGSDAVSGVGNGADELVGGNSGLLK